MRLVHEGPSLSKRFSRQSKLKFFMRRLPSFLNDFLTGSSGVHFLDPFDCLLQTCPSFCKLRIGLQSGVKCEWFITERRCSSIMAIHAFQLRWWHCVSHLVGGIVSQSAD